MQKPSRTMRPTLANLVTGMPCFLLKSLALFMVISFIHLISISGLVMSGEVREAHTHGVATLTVAFENEALELQFESPAMSLLGFEHKPGTKKQIETIENTKEILGASEKVISIEGADCSPDSVNIDIHGPAGHGLKSARKQEHDHHDSDESHIDHDESHSEILATYLFDCVGSEQIRSIAVALFEYFPGLETINVTWVTGTQQGQDTLRSKSSSVELR